MATRWTCVLALAVVAACGGEEETCEDPTYGNGTCDLAGACGTVDIDCFTTFETQAEAQAWRAEFEALLAQQEGTPPRPLLPPTDPRFAPVQAMLDAGWEGYKATHPLYELAEHTPQLVIVDTSGLQSAAFVMADHRTRFQTAALAVMVETDLLEQSPTDEELLSIMMHELEHAVGLHVILGARERFLKAYVAGPDEPFGFEQAEDPIARQHLDDWLALAGDVGHLSDDVLSGMPLRRSTVHETMERAIAVQAQTNPSGCAGALSAVNTLYAQVGGNINELTGGISLNDPNMAVLNAFLRLRDECFTSFSLDFIAAHAMVTGATEASIIANLTPQELTNIDNVNFVVGMYNYTRSRRGHMRATEASFQAATGQPWKQLRYFSTEEAADDSSVSTMTQIGRDPRAIGSGLLRVLYSPAAQTACRAEIDAGMVPHYGENLIDDHHSTCWRAFHAGALADAGVFAARRSPAAEAELRPAIAPRVAAPTWRPLPMRPKLPGPTSLTGR